MNVRDMGPSDIFDSTLEYCVDIRISWFSVKRKSPLKISCVVRATFSLSPNAYFYSVPHKKFSMFYQSVFLRY